jgi:CRP-like cAMP-binding protein
MMSQKELKAMTVFRSVELTHDLKTHHLHKLASVSSEVEFAKGQIIYQPGDVGEAIYVIESGQVIIELDVSGRESITILTFGPGEFFGWSSLFPLERKTARARAIKPTRAVAINADRLRTAMESDQDLEYAIDRCAVKVMAERIKITRQQLVANLTLVPQL